MQIPEAEPSKSRQVQVPLVRQRLQTGYILDTNTKNSMPPHLQQAGCLARLLVQLHPQGQQEPPALRRRRDFHRGWSPAVRGRDRPRVSLAVQGPGLPPRRNPAGWGRHSAFLRDATPSLLALCKVLVFFRTITSRNIFGIFAVKCQDECRSGEPWGLSTPTKHLYVMTHVKIKCLPVAPPFEMYRFLPESVKVLCTCSW
jgi:hypothetical protein